jgi:hypothetical protein
MRAEPLVTAIVWPLMTTDDRCATHPALSLTSVTVAGEPREITTPPPASAGSLTMARYCLAALSLPESTASIILTEIVAPADGAFCVCEPGIDDR